MSCWDQSCTDHRILCLQTPTSWSRHTVISHIERLGSWAVFEQAPAGSAIYIFSEERWRPCSLVTWCSEFRCKEELWFCHMFSLGGNFIQFLSQSIPLQASQQKNSSTSSTHFNKTSCCFVILHICPPKPSPGNIPAARHIEMEVFQDSDGKNVRRIDSDGRFLVPGRIGSECIAGSAGFPL